eukprot:3116633-Amphidinium_carterae.2
MVPTIRNHACCMCNKCSSAGTRRHLIEEGYRKSRLVLSLWRRSKELDGILGAQMVEIEALKVCGKCTSAPNSSVQLRVVALELSNDDDDELMMMMMSH